MKCPLPVKLFFLSILAISLLTACTRQSSPSTPIYYYTLSAAPAALSFDQPLPSVVRVDRFSVSPPFNTQRMIFADKGLHRNAYAHHQWIADPGELAAFFIARSLRRTNAFKAVLTPDSALPPTHIVNGWVEEFVEQDLPDQWMAAARIHITLIDPKQPDPGRRILFQKSYDASAPCADKTPAALAEAMSAAVAEISANSIKDIYDRLADTITAQ